MFSEVFQSHVSGHLSELKIGEDVFGKQCVLVLFGALPGNMDNRELGQALGQAREMIKRLGLEHLCVAVLKNGLAWKGRACRMTWGWSWHARTVTVVFTSYFLSPRWWTSGQKEMLICLKQELPERPAHVECLVYSIYSCRGCPSVMELGATDFLLLSSWW